MVSIAGCVRLRSVCDQAGNSSVAALTTKSCKVHSSGMSMAKASAMGVRTCGVSQGIRSDGSNESAAASRISHSKTVMMGSRRQKFSQYDLPAAQGIGF